MQLRNRLSQRAHRREYHQPEHHDKLWTWGEVFSLKLLRFLRFFGNPWAPARDPRRMEANQKLSSAWTMVKVLETLDGTRKFELEVAPEGYYRFRELRWKEMRNKSHPDNSSGYWANGHISSLYDTVEAVERSARSFTKLAFKE